MPFEHNQIHNINPFAKTVAQIFNLAPSANLFEDSTRMIIDVAYNALPKNSRPKKEDLFSLIHQVITHRCIFAHNRRVFTQYHKNDDCKKILLEIIKLFNASPEDFKKIIPLIEVIAKEGSEVKWNTWCLAMEQELKVFRTNTSSGSQRELLIDKLNKNALNTIKLFADINPHDEIPKDLLPSFLEIRRYSKEPSHDAKIIYDALFSEELRNDSSVSFGIKLLELTKICYQAKLSFISPDLQFSSFAAKEEMADAYYLNRIEENFLKKPSEFSTSYRAKWIQYLFSRCSSYPQLDRISHISSLISSFSADTYQALVSARQKLGTDTHADEIFVSMLEVLQPYASSSDLPSKITLKIHSFSTHRASTCMRLVSEIGGLEKKETRDRLLGYIEQLNDDNDIQNLIQAVYKAGLKEYSDKNPERPLEEVAQAFIENKNAKETISSVELQQAVKQYKDILIISQNYGAGLLKLPNFNQSSVKPEIFIGIAREEFKKNYGVYPFNSQVITMLLAINRIESNKDLHGVYSQIGTGEGKSFVISFIAAYFAYKKQPVDILTSNSYLAERDAQKYAPFFKSLGLTSSCFDIENSSHVAEAETIGKEPAIIYSTENSLALHYLLTGLRGKDFFLGERFGILIADESDYLMLDSHSRGVRIASGTISDSTFGTIDYNRLIEIADSLPTKFSSIKELILEARKILSNNQYDLSSYVIDKLDDITLLVLLYSAIESKSMKKDVHFAIDSNQDLVILDAGSTGRQMAGMQWSYGLHSMVAIRNQANVKLDQDTMAFFSLHVFINMYKKIVCLSATIGGTPERQQLQSLYNISGFDVPPYRESKREDFPISLFNTKKEASDYYFEKIKLMHSSGRPVLFLCETVEESYRLHEILRQQGYTPQLLNDVTNLGSNSEPLGEEDIIRAAGNVGSITVATNVAGRGTNIIISEDATLLGGLYDIISFIPENLRVEVQARGRAGRQGNPGSSEITCSLEDAFFEHLTEREKQFVIGIREQYGADSQQVNSIIYLLREIHGHIMMERELLACSLDKEHDTIIREFFKGIKTKAPELLVHRKKIFETLELKNVIEEILKYWTARYQNYDLIKQFSSIMYQIAAKQLVTTCNEGLVPAEIQEDDEFKKALDEIQSEAAPYLSGLTNLTIEENQLLTDILDTLAIRLYFARTDESLKLWHQQNQYLRNVATDALAKVRKDMPPPTLNFPFKDEAHTS